MKFCGLENYSCQGKTPTSDLTACLAPLFSFFFLTCSVSHNLYFHFNICLMWTLEKTPKKTQRGKYLLDVQQEKVPKFTCLSFLIKHWKEKSSIISHAAVLLFHYRAALFSYCFEVQLDHSQWETYSLLVRDSYKHQLTHSAVSGERHKPAERVAVFMGKRVEKPLLSLICHKGDLCACDVRTLFGVCIDSSHAAQRARFHISGHRIRYETSPQREWTWSQRGSKCTQLNLIYLLFLQI